MDVRQLRYFLAIVDHGSVHRAAEELFVAQPSISQALRALERDLGAQLFHRTGRRLVLSSTGEALIEPARQVLRWLELARASVQAAEGLQAGQLVLATMPSQSVHPLTTLISTFTTRYPLMRISVLAAATPADVAALLRTGSAELGLVATRPGASAGDLVGHQIDAQRFILVAPPDLGLPATTPLRFADLAGIRLVVGQPGTGMRRVADAVLAAAPGSHAVVEIEHRAAILPLVLAGVGAAVLSESWRQLAEATGALVRDLDCDEWLEVSLVHRSGPLSPAAAAFLTTTGALAEQ